MSLATPASFAPGETVSVTVSGTSEVGRRLYVFRKFGTGACATTAYSEYYYGATELTGTGSGGSGEAVDGAFTRTYTFTPADSGSSLRPRHPHLRLRRRELDRYSERRRDAARPQPRRRPRRCTRHDRIRARRARDDRPGRRSTTACEPARSDHDRDGDGCYDRVIGNVRLTAKLRRAGGRIRVVRFALQRPAGTKVTYRCAGAPCRTPRGRYMDAGDKIEIFVARSYRYGRYVRLSVRRYPRLGVRSVSRRCLVPAQTKRVACPA